MLDNAFVIIISRAAEIDLDESFIWYEEQKNNLGFEFINAFESTLNQILLNPYYASIIEADARYASLKRFPYSVIYRVNLEQLQIRVIAIIHQHRHPSWISSRI